MIAGKDFLDFVDTLDGEEFVTAVVYNGQRAEKGDNK